MNILIKLINDVKALCNTIISTANAIKAKTDTITANLFTSTHASRIDANISSRQADAGLTTTHASRIDASISSRALETTAQAIKAKTDLLSAGLGGIKSVQRGTLTLNSGSSSSSVTHASVNVDKSFIILSSNISNNSIYIDSRTATSCTFRYNYSSVQTISWQLVEFV